METIKVNSKKSIDPKEKATVFTVFTLFFPSLIITAVATMYTELIMAAICVALFIYQAALLKRYVESQQV